MLLSADVPILAVLTEPDAASSLQRIKETVEVFKSVLGIAELISVRVEGEQERAKLLTNEILRLVNESNTNKTGNTVVVVNDNVDIAVSCGAHGVHIKENKCNVEVVKKIREAFLNDDNREIVIGSSCHSVQSAVSAAKAGVDYIFVGTCFPTLSHPDKLEIEGPQLVGRVKKRLDDLGFTNVACLGIGGITGENCDVLIRTGGDGVAVIRSVTRAENPSTAASFMKLKMKESFQLRTNG